MKIKHTQESNECNQSSSKKNGESKNGILCWCNLFLESFNSLLLLFLWVLQLLLDCHFFLQNFVRVKTCLRVPIFRFTLREQWFIWIHQLFQREQHHQYLQQHTLREWHNAFQSSSIRSWLRLRDDLLWH